MQQSRRYLIFQFGRFVWVFDSFENSFKENLEKIRFKKIFAFFWSTFDLFYWKEFNKYSSFWCSKSWEESLDSSVHVTSSVKIVLFVVFEKIQSRLKISARIWHKIWISVPRYVLDMATYRLQNRATKPQTKFFTQIWEKVFQLSKNLNFHI